MRTGVYESLLTADLDEQLRADRQLQAEFGAVDDAEQALAIALHLAPLIERSLRVARSAEERADLTRRILGTFVGPLDYSARPEMRVSACRSFASIQRYLSMSRIENASRP